MVLYKRSLVHVPKVASMLGVKGVSRPLSVRFNSSSVNKVDTPSNNTASTDNNNKKVQLENKISFMPVINIPETEFAHHTFFALDRPLLGLSDEEEKPFFSNKTELSEEEKLDDMLANYMMHLQPFVPPENIEKEQEEPFIQIRQEEIEDIEYINRQPELPMYHMPESQDVLDYLSTIESNMKREHAKLDKEEGEKALRLKKLEILDHVKRLSSRPRFINNRNTIQQRLRRYQLYKKD